MTSTGQTMEQAAEMVADALRAAGYADVKVWDKRGVRVYFSERLSRGVKPCGFVEMLDGSTFSQSGITAARARVRGIVESATGLRCS